MNNHCRWNRCFESWLHAAVAACRATSDVPRGLVAMRPAFRRGSMRCVVVCAGITAAAAATTAVRSNSCSDWRVTCRMHAPISAHASAGALRCNPAVCREVSHTSSSLWWSLASLSDGRTRITCKNSWWQADCRDSRAAGHQSAVLQAAGRR